MPEGGKFAGMVLALLFTISEDLNEFLDAEFIRYIWFSLDILGAPKCTFLEVLNDPELFGKTAVNVSCPYSKELSFSKKSKKSSEQFSKKNLVLANQLLTGVILWDLRWRSRRSKGDNCKNLPGIIRGLESDLSIQSFFERNVVSNRVVSASPHSFQANPKRLPNFKVSIALNCIHAFLYRRMKFGQKK